MLGEGRFGQSPFNIDEFLILVSPTTVTSKFPNVFQFRKITSNCRIFDARNAIVKKKKKKLNINQIVYKKKSNCTPVSKM